MSNEIHQIIEKLSAAPEGSRFILATVIDLKGSGYRLPGAKMLIAENGDVLGTVSGGCLEADVLERARRVIKSRRPEILTYDTTGKDDSVFSLNMGCRGVVRILIEEIDARSQLLENMRTAVNERRRQTVFTVFSGGEPGAIGARGFYSSDAGFEFLGLESSTLKDTVSRFHNEDRLPNVFDLDDLEIYIESIDPPINLVIFGGGFDALPLAEVAKTLGWRVEIADHRPAYADEKRFPDVEKIVAAPFENAIGKLTFDDQTVAVLMTHNYEKDREILGRILDFDLKYIGMLGPKARTARIIDEIRAELAIFDESSLENLYGPIGLDIGADSPESIAVSIIAEIKSVLRGRSGGFLRERSGSIYSRESS